METVMVRSPSPKGQKTRRDQDHEIALVTGSTSCWLWAADIAEKKKSHLGIYPLIVTMPLNLPLLLPPTCQNKQKNFSSFLQWTCWENDAPFYSPSTEKITSHQAFALASFLNSLHIGIPWRILLSLLVLFLSLLLHCPEQSHMFLWRLPSAQGLSPLTKARKASHYVFLSDFQFSLSPFNSACPKRWCFCIMCCSLHKSSCSRPPCSCPVSPRPGVTPSWLRVLVNSAWRLLPLTSFAPSLSSPHLMLTCRAA